MEKTGTFFTRMSTRLDLPPEAVGRESQVLISGRHQVTIEGHRGIALYDPACIEVRGLQGVIRMEGHGLQVAFLEQTQVAIRGTIDSVTLEGGK